MVQSGEPSNEPTVCKSHRAWLLVLWSLNKITKTCKPQTLTPGYFTPHNKTVFWNQVNLMSGNKGNRGKHLPSEGARAAPGTRHGLSWVVMPPWAHGDGWLIWTWNMEEIKAMEMETMKGHGINPISKFLHKSGTGQETLTGCCAVIITSSLCALQWDTEPAPGSLAHMHSITSTATCSPCQEGFYPKIFRSQKIFSVIFTQFQHKLSPEKQRKYIHISRGHAK